MSMLMIPKQTLNGHDAMFGFVEAGVNGVFCKVWWMYLTQFKILSNTKKYCKHIVRYEEMCNYQLFY